MVSIGHDPGRSFDRLARRFTTVEPTYSKFIEWQWYHLREAGHVNKGAHPVRYCPQCENPVGDHDLLEGDKAEIQKFTLIMFQYGDAFIALINPQARDKSMEVAKSLGEYHGEYVKRTGQRMELVISGWIPRV